MVSDFYGSFLSLLPSMVQWLEAGTLMITGLDLNPDCALTSYVTLTALFPHVKMGIIGLKLSSYLYF